MSIKANPMLGVNFVICLPGQVLLGTTLLELQGAFPTSLSYYLFAPVPLALFLFAPASLAAFLLPFSVHISRGPAKMTAAEVGCCFSDLVSSQ
eukprot:scaffold255070_cov18-Tisochrysis_lutea.AAC.1